MSEHLRILHVVPCLNPAAGGPSRSVLGLANAQASQGVSVLVVAGEQKERLESSNSTNLSIRTAPLLPLPYSLPSPSFIKLLRQSISTVDLVHLHSIWNGTISAAAWICRLAAKPMVLSPRGMMDKHNMAHHGQFKRIYLRLCDNRNFSALSGLHFLDVTEQEGCFWLDSKQDLPVVIQPNGMDTETIPIRLEKLKSYLPNILLSDSDAYHLLFLGRLNAIKGLELQVEVLADLRSTGLNVHLHWIGPDDGEWSSLQSLALELGVDSALHWHGPVYGDERLGWLREADAILLTSHYECNSNTAAETLAVGGVLIATDTCHLDLAEAAGAALVVPRDRRQLTETILNLFSTPSQGISLRRHAQGFARSELNWGVLAGRMIDFYQSLLRGNV